LRFPSRALNVRNYVFDIQNYTGFVMAILAFQIVPGPGTLAILSSTARHGVRAGIGAVFGTLAGDFLFMIAAVLGLAAVLTTHPAVLSSLQWVGIIYLCWLGAKLLRAASSSAQPDQARLQTPGVCFRQAFAVCLTNPKAILFFVAFFPLFLAPASKPSTLAIMVAHVSLISLVYQTGLVFVGNAVSVRLSGFSRAGVWASRLVGLGLLGFGIKLAISAR
jgi:leucine efflux protein